MSTNQILQQNAIKSMYEEHHVWLRVWINRRLGCPIGAADLAQDTFLNLLLKADLPVLHEPKAYLSRIAHGLLVDYIRRRDLERAYLEALVHISSDEVGSPESRALMLELLIRLDMMLDGLSVKVRTAFLLAQLEGKSYQEIATHLGVSTRTVGTYVATAMLQCMALLQE